MTMSKDIKTAVPALRFPEFRESGEWEVKTFSKYIRLYRGSSPRPIQEYLTQSETGVNWIKIGDTKLAENYIIHKVEEKITPEGALKSRKVSKGELILANSMSFGKTYQLAIDGFIYDGWFVLREYESFFNKAFLLQLLNSEYMQKQYSKLSAGGIVQNISSDIVYQTELPHTSIPEQQKIANCLLSLDDLITVVADKIAALRLHKKGLMQQLFPAEGKITPALRFPEFRDSGEWEEKRIKDLKLDIITGFAFKGNDISELKDGIRLMRGINITEGYIRHTDDIDRYYLGSTERLSKYVLKINDLVIGMDGSKVGKNISLITDIDSESLLVQRVARLRSQNDSLIKYLFQQINSSRFFSYVDRINTSSGIPHISQKQIEEFMVWIPDDGLEVKKIGDLLASIDDQVFSETQKLETLKSHKKGLMQQLFPTIY